MKRSLGSVTTLALFVTGCSGGGAASTPMAKNAAAQNVSVHIFIPLATASAARDARRPAYVSPNTASASITVTPSGGNPGAPQIVNLGPTANGCAASVNPAGTLCVVAVQAPAGPDTFAVALYSAADAGGTALSTNTVTQTVAANQANLLSLTLNGVVASFTIAAPVLYEGTPASAAAITATALDASGATIVGPGAFANPITIAVSGDASVSVGTAVIAGPSTPATVAYTGKIHPASVTVPGSATGATQTAGATFAPFNPAAITANGAGPSAWYDLADATTVTVATNSISAIADRSGNGNTLTEATIPLRPTYAFPGTQTRFGTQGYASFTSSQFITSATGFPTSGDFDIVIVTDDQAFATTYGPNIYGSPTGGAQALNFSGAAGGSLPIQFYGSNGSSSQTTANPSGAPPTAPYLLEGYSASGLVSVVIDGNFGSPTSYTATRSPGIQLNATGGAYNGQGDIAEVIVYPFALSAAQRAQLTTYFKGKYDSTTF